MSVEHDVTTTLGDIRVPTGIDAHFGKHILEMEDEPDGAYDRLGRYAQIINDLYEHMRPPLINCYPYTPWATTSATYAELARWKVPSSHCGTGVAFGGTDPEGLASGITYSVSGGGTASLKIETVQGSSERGSLTSASAVNVDVPSSGQLDFDDTLSGYLSDLDLVLYGKTTAGTLSVRDIEVRWASGRSNLPDGPYDNGFIPLSTLNGVAAQYAGKTGDATHRYQAVTPPRMQRLTRDLFVLKRTRTPGTICQAHFGTAGFVYFDGVPPSAFTATLAQGLTKQHQYVHTARFWAYGQDGGALTVTLGDQSGTISGFFSGVPTWQFVDIEMPVRDRVRKLAWKVTSPSTGPNLIYALSAFWLPITRRLEI